METGPLNLERETAALVDASSGAGAIVTFVGLARRSATTGEQVDKLVLDDHPRLTQQSLDEIAAAAVEKFAVAAVRVAHRSGMIAAGEPIVFAGAAAAHRRDAFDAVDYLMDRLKTEAVFWKREEGPGGSQLDRADGCRLRRTRAMVMAGIDESLPFYPLRIAVLTVSDTRTEETDKSGALLAERLTGAGHELAGQAIVADDVEAIRAQVRSWADDDGIDVIISTGGTGFAPRDVTPEAVKPLCPPRDGRVRGAVPPSQRRNGRTVHAPVARLCRTDRRHVHLLPAGLDRRLPRCLGPGPVAGARQPLPALLARGPGAAPAGARRMSGLTHLDESGRVRMVDVSGKEVTARSATAVGTLTCGRETLEQVRAGTAPKGSVIATAELAGIMAAKRTAELIPLCHPLPLTKVEVRIEIDDGLPGFRSRRRDADRRSHRR